MALLAIGVADLETVKARTHAAFSGAPQGCTYTFLTEADLLSTLTVNRWAILKALTGTGSLGMGELARRVARDERGVQTDAQALVRCGLIDKTADGKLLFPYDAVRLELVYKAAA